VTSGVDRANKRTCHASGRVGGSVSGTRHPATKLDASSAEGA